MPYSFEIVDVFTNERFGGNPLAVVPDARGLTGRQMQQIANEFNLSETTFVFPPEDRSHTALVRIFTPTSELPFAGHPNVGTAYVLARQGDIFGRSIEDHLFFEEKAGVVPIRLQRDIGGVQGASLEAPQPFSIGSNIPSDIIARAAGLAPEEVDSTNHPPLIASAGTPFVFAQVKSRKTLSTAAPATDVFKKHIPVSDAVGLHLYSMTTDGHSDIAARMFAPQMGIAEDPATGGANIALAGLLAHLAPKQTLTLEIKISQGVDMGRPSLLHATASKSDGTVNRMSIGGNCVSVMQGTIAVDEA